MKNLVIALIVLFVLFQGSPPLAGDDPRFEFLKSLEGTWVDSAPEEGAPAGVIEFRVTAGGTAIEEREFVGSPMEMVTLYHMKGRELVATHYCMLGNQPHLTATKKVVDDSLSFSCNGKPSNTASHDEKHVHAWTLTLDGDGKLVYSAELVEDGTVAEAPAFVLTRR